MERNTEEGGHGEHPSVPIFTPVSSLVLRTSAPIDGANFWRNDQSTNQMFKLNT